MNTYPSKLLESAVNELSKLPGIGRKTAVRLVLHLLKEREEEVDKLGNSLIRMRKEVRYCSVCFNVSENETCELCSDPKRDRSTLCVVQDVRDVMAIENTQQYRGLYHILGGVISPMEGIGPEDLTLESLISRSQQPDIKELIIALPATMEGDTTSFYIYRKMSGSPVILSTIARGVSVGNELEYTDEITLGRSILCRVPYEGK